MEKLDQAESRMTYLTKAAEHIAICNYPEQPIDMDLIQENDLEIQPAELPVLQQLVRDYKAAELNENSNSDAEDLPKLTKLDKEPEEDQTETEKPTSPASKRSKVVITTSVQNSPVIHAKRPDRSMEVGPSPLVSLRGNLTLSSMIILTLYLAGVSGLPSKPGTPFVGTPGAKSGSTTQEEIDPSPIRGKTLKCILNKIIKLFFKGQTMEQLQEFRRQLGKLIFEARSPGL